MLSKYNRIAYKHFLKIVGFSKDKTSRNLFRLFQIAVYAAIIVFIVNLFSLGHSSFGEWGDFFGGVLNPILTFLTFMGLLITIILQQSELKESRKEFQRSADALYEQSASIKKQNFENTFFNLIDLHNKITDGLKINLEEFETENFLKKATEGLKKIVDIFSSVLANLEISSDSSTPRIFNGREVFEVLLNIISYDAKSPKEILERYIIIQTEKNHIVGHYFRNLYQILKLIDNTDDSILSPKEKRKYASIIRAQLSTKELALLSINCLAGVSDRGQFKNLLVKFSMLEHLSMEKTELGYALTGSDFAILSDQMILEYKAEEKLGAFELIKYFGGAFGKNKNIQYDLKSKNNKE